MLRRHEGGGKSGHKKKKIQNDKKKRIFVSIKPLFLNQMEKKSNVKVINV